MAKPVIKFSAVAYQLGSGAQVRTGYRPQLEPQEGRYDLDFCREVVTEKRLSMSPEELLHAMEMVGEVGPAKVAEDGRPRGITKLLKYNRYAQGNLESPTSPWNDSCKAVIRAQLMWDADKEIDASFENVMSGIGVKVNYVAWVGAQEVINVVKIGKQIGVYGNHMEFISGDTATLTVGTTAYSLTCVESDVAHAVFNWPAGLAPEAGTPAEFVMKSRGGVEDGQVYTSKKTVVVLAADVPPTLYTSARGGTKVYTAVDENGNALPAGPIKSMTATAKMNLTGVFYQTPDADPDTGVSHIYLDGVGTERIELMGVFAEDHGSLTIRLGECITQVAAGTYANAKLSFKCYKDSQADSLEIPFTLIKG